MLSSVQVPQHLFENKEWGALLYIFLNTPKLTGFVDTHIDFEEGIVEAQRLKRISRPWSDSEKFMLNLALHCFNSANPIDLSDMDLLDNRNREVAFSALITRYGRGLAI